MQPLEKLINEADDMHLFNKINFDLNYAIKLFLWRVLLSCHS